MNRYHTISLLLLTLVLAGGLIVPLEAGAAIVPSCGVSVDQGGHLINPCGFDALMQLIQNAITFLLWFTVPVAALLFSYAGFLYLTAGDNPGNVEKAHKIFKDAVIGVVIMLVAWLVVYLITTTLLKPNYQDVPLLERIR